MVNLFDISTSSGTKSIELMNADITEIGTQYDLLIVSAFQGSYSPSPGTLVCHLWNKYQIDLMALEQNPALDLRKSLNAWITHELTFTPFKRIVCIEMSTLEGVALGEYTNIVRDLFSFISLLPTRDIAVGIIAMPLLGTGNQGIAPEEVLPALMDMSKKALENIAPVRKIVFAELNKEKYGKLNDSLNRYLKRSSFDVSDYTANDLSISPISDTLAPLQRILDRLKTLDQTHIPILNDFKQKICGEKIKAYDLLISCRKIAELVVCGLLNQQELKKDLLTSIEELPSRGIANWVVSYLHLIRIIGNRGAHVKKIRSIPPELNEKDLYILLASVYRVLDFWDQFMQNHAKLK